MGDDAELFEVLADLEAHAETVHHLERVAEVADRSRTEYHAVLLEGRFMASLGTAVTLTVVGVGTLRGTLDRVGDGWCRLESGPVRWTVRTPAVLTARGLSERAVPRLAWSRLDTVGPASPLRALADAAEVCAFHLVDGSAVEGRVRRVGGDFVEVVAGGLGAQGPATATRADAVLLPLSAVAAWRSGAD